MRHTHHIRRTLATAVVALAAISGVATMTAPTAAAAPPSIGIHQVDQVVGLPYATLFAVGVQVYEFAGYDKDETAMPILHRLYDARQGTKGSIRYGFVGKTLPAAFVMGVGRNVPSPALSADATVVPVDPTTHKWIECNPQIVADLHAVSGPIGRLNGGVAVAYPNIYALMPSCPR